MAEAGKESWKKRAIRGEMEFFASITIVQQLRLVDSETGERERGIVEERR